jgi:hypothetical protein
MKSFLHSSISLVFLKSCVYQWISYAEICNAHAVDLTDGNKKFRAMLGGRYDKRSQSINAFTFSLIIFVIHAKHSDVIKKGF